SRSRSRASAGVPSAFRQYRFAPAQPHLLPRFSLRLAAVSPCSPPVCTPQALPARSQVSPDSLDGIRPRLLPDRPPPVHVSCPLEAEEAAARESHQRRHLCSTDPPMLAIRQC